MKEWIPIEKKKPPYDKDVLFTMDEFFGGGMIVGHRENEYGEDIYTTGEFGSGSFDAVAWMPLPEPYSKE